MRMWKRFGNKKVLLLCAVNAMNGKNKQVILKSLQCYK